MNVLGYKFDDAFYADNSAGQQELLEAVLNAVTTEAHCDDTITVGEEQATIDATFENTIVEGSPWGGMTFWQNCEVMNRDSHYPLNIERVTDESDPDTVAGCKSWLDLD